MTDHIPQTVHIIPVLSDNYVYAIEHSPGKALIVDPGEAKPVLEFLNARGLTLDTILLTHHHGDHIAGCQNLMEQFPCDIFGPEKDMNRVPVITKPLNDGDTVKIGNFEAYIIETPGHTKNHICYWNKNDNILFSGDTLFLMGCGRLFEGTPKDMYNSLKKLAALPDETRVYCGHEYTLDNGRFCLTIEPENVDLKQRLIEEQHKRNDARSTMPSTIGIEKKTNAFVRAKNEDDFARIRSLKDSA